MKRAIGEPSKISFCRQGSKIPASVVPRKVTAITRVASRTMVWKLTMLKAYRIEMITEGITISSNALIGVRVFGSILETHSGSMRSSAAAKITRVEDRKTVPDQPNHHIPTRKIMISCRARLPVRKEANCTGYGQTGIATSVP